jgi:hypothetical protein
VSGGESDIVLKKFQERIIAMTRTVITVALAALVCCVVYTDMATAGETVTVGRKWPAAQHVSMDTVDHSTWDALLKKYVDQRGDVNYRAWKANGADVRALDGYLASLSRAAATAQSTREAQLAYWINAYNAVTIKGILREYPTTSIRNHTARFIGYNIWHDLKLITPSGQHSLEHIEHQVLRKMGESRIHFAIVCASKGCPRLRAEAYTAEQLEQQLADNTRNFFADSAKFRFDPRNRKVHLSPILAWFAEDFGSDQRRQLATVASYLPAAVAQQIAAGNVEIVYLDYDWGLNDQQNR